MNSITLSAPGKVNLGLRIVGTTADGRHTLETLMLKIDLADRLHIRLARGRGKIEITGNIPDIMKVPRAEGNLVHAAWKLFEQEYQTVELTARLEKNIPIEAGLGGGSSDGAAMLRGLRALTGIPENHDELRSLGERFGADVPFFLISGHALASGTGDILRRVYVPRTWMVLLKPPRGVSTAAAYRRWDERPVRQAGAPRDVASALRDRDWDLLSACLANDLGAVLLPTRDDMQRGIRALKKAGSIAATVSGSGSTLVGIVEDREHGRRTAERIEKQFPGWFCRLTATVDGGEE